MGHHELRDPRPTHPTVDLGDWGLRWLSGAEKCHYSSVARSSQFTVRDAGREGSEVSREGVELRSFRGSWSRLRSMLSEPDASRSGKSGLVSSSTRRYLKLVIGSVHLLEGHKRAGE